MTTFALVHGGWHGAWCWELLTPILETAGHDVVAMDLPAQDGSADFNTYSDLVCDAIDGRDDDVIVVGHSMNGSAASLVAARRPVRHVVYLCALIPALGRSLQDQFATETGMSDFGWMAGMGEFDAQGAQAWVHRGLAKEILFADCDDIAAEGAIDRLRPASPPSRQGCIPSRRIPLGEVHFRDLLR
ncbi:alpha/beta fold hydrolase [Mycobacterium stomatepiae]|nr:alpha/beta fold hydrolase [Mycobacterium stomatepiae]MCV7167572.1 alpha/beta fold hydrolase [Mycobacterium stomatepiae]